MIWPAPKRVLPEGIELDLLIVEIQDTPANGNRIPLYRSQHFV